MDHRGSFTYLLLTLLYCVDPKTFVSAEKFKLCVAEYPHNTKKIHRICSQLATPESRVECVIANDRFNCLRRLTTGEADIAVLEPEELVAASSYSEYDILVTNEVRELSNDKQRFDMVAIIHSDAKNSYVYQGDIKGKRFCHPGFEIMNEWTRTISTYFENWVIPKQCDPDKTLLENRVMAVSDYFETACIPGRWTWDALLDATLKSRYKNLCALCDSPISCHVSDKYYGFRGALLCLIEVGDVAWVKLEDALLFFEQDHVNKKDYLFLCPDGTTRPFEDEAPCVWMKKPWPVVVARRDLAEKVSKYLSSLKQPLMWNVNDVLYLLGDNNPTPVSTDTLETPEDYLRRFPGFMSANNRATCRPSRRVQWCVASNLEDRKCRWLREASFVYGIEPTIACIQEPNRAGCLEAVRSKRADIFVARPEELVEARKKGLRSILRVVPKKKEELDRIAVIVKKDSRFTKLSDLRGAKACFAGYRNVAWYAFHATMKNLSYASKECSDTEAISSFFKDSCVLGLGDKRSQVPSNLYSLCKQEGNADDESALDCLTSGLADVAIVNLKTIENKTGRLEERPTSGGAGKKGYRMLCTHDGETEEEGTCLLAWTTPAVVIAHENITEVRHDEIYSMLLDMDKLFGKNFEWQPPAFSLYGAYDSNRSIIFPEETYHLQLDVNLIQRVRSYDEIVEDVLKEATCSAENHWNSYYSTTILYTVLVILSQL